MRDPYYDITAVSNSSLSRLNPEQGGSPRRFKNYIEGRDEERELKSLERGKLLHLSIFEPDKVKVSDVVKPTGKMEMLARSLSELGLRSDELSIETIAGTAKAVAYGKNWKDETIAKKFREEGAQYHDFLVTEKDSDTISVTAETKSIVNRCVDALGNHPIAKFYLFEEPGWVEEPWYWSATVKMKGQRIEIPCKAKIDKLTKNGVLIDLKTTGKPIALFQKAFEYYRYYRQIAFYSRAVRTRDDRPNSIIELIIAVETNPPHEVRVFEVSDEWHNKGADEYRALLYRYAYHEAHNNWSQSMEEMKSKTGRVFFNEPDLEQQIHE